MLYALWIAIAFFVNRLTSLDPEIAAKIIGAMVTVFVTLTAVIITQRGIKLREIAEAHRGKKVEIYVKYLTKIASLFFGQNDQVTIKAPSEQELIDYIVGFKTEILLWGSPKVITSQIEFERSGSDRDRFKALDNLFKAIREDIGLNNASLNNLELVKIFIKDPNELDKIMASNNAN